MFCGKLWPVGLFSEDKGDYTDVWIIKKLSTSESIWGGVYMPHKMDTQDHLAIFRESSSCGAYPARQYTYISPSMLEPNM